MRGIVGANVMKNTFCNALKTDELDELKAGGGRTTGRMDACSDWHSKIDFHYIFVGGIRNVIMSRGGVLGLHSVIWVAETL